MNKKKMRRGSAKALDDAAKYICTMKYGLCPMAAEKFPCPQTCTQEIRPWQCWVTYFLSKHQPLLAHERSLAERGGAQDGNAAVR
jgi:hypothetical protein